MTLLYSLCLLNSLYLIYPIGITLNLETIFSFIAGNSCKVIFFNSIAWLIIKDGRGSWCIRLKIGLIIGCKIIGIVRSWISKLGGIIWFILFSFSWKSITWVFCRLWVVRCVSLFKATNWLAFNRNTWLTRWACYRWFDLRDGGEGRSFIFFWFLFDSSQLLRFFCLYQSKIFGFNFCNCSILLFLLW